ncbi:MAG: FHA domain-containing protein [Gemmataceae bacterium]|nr:FHA domain-containing protein [Gemmataceae bacterium]
MALLSRIYYNAVFGGLGGLLGWMLFGVVGAKNPSESERVVWFLTPNDLNMLLGGAVIGALIGYFVVSVEAIRDLSLLKFARLATYGAALGSFGGALGMYLGDKLNYLIVGVGLTGGAAPLLLVMLARGLGWTMLGVAIGMSEGFAARSLGKFSYGTIGGAIGGFVGGALFMYFYESARRSGDGAALWQAVGLVILGACIGSLSALVQGVFQPACVRVLRGWQEGREYPLDKPQNLLGRAEHADIPLFRDMKVEKQHAYIRQQDGQYWFVNNHAPPEQTLVNDRPVSAAVVLNDGDRIQLGNVVLRFHLRAARPRARWKKPLPS